MNELEKQILKEANKNWFADKRGASKQRITSIQAQHIIAAWLKFSMPVFLEDDNG